LPSEAAKAECTSSTATILSRSDDHEWETDSVLSRSYSFQSAEK
jgi:hypothetical protein